MSMQAGQCPFFFFFFSPVGERRGKAGGIVFGVKILLQSIWIAFIGREEEQSRVGWKLAQFSANYTLLPLAPPPSPVYPNRLLKLFRDLAFSNCRQNFHLCLNVTETPLIQFKIFPSITLCHFISKRVNIGSLFCTFDLQQYHEFLSVSIQIES